MRHRRRSHLHLRSSVFTEPNAAGIIIDCVGVSAGGGGGLIRVTRRDKVRRPAAGRGDDKSRPFCRSSSSSS